MRLRYAETWNTPRRVPPAAPIAQAPGVFSEAECRAILTLPEHYPPVTASPSYDAGSLQALASRTGRASWLPLDARTDWIYERLDGMIDAANDGLFHLPLVSVETLQLSRYTAGDRFDTHADFGLLHATRLLSVSVQMSASDAYDGGDLEFLSAAYGRNEAGHERATWGEVLGTANRELGTGVFFPAWVPHRVTPVTRGERWSLVAWVRGEPLE